MYTRGTSIASIFQKAILLKDTKCNKIIQRTLCSDSSIKFSKIEKFKPMKRYFSGASNSRNPNQRNRYIHGIGYIRKALPKFPREMVQQQQHQLPLSMNEQMISQGIACGNLGLAVNGNASNISGKITVVLDKNEICGCPDENIQIFVTTSPERMQPPQQLTRVNISDNRSVKCNCCPTCQEVNNFGIQKTFSMRPNINAFQQPSNSMNFPNHLPMRRRNSNGYATPGQNVYGLPQTNLRLLNGERTLNIRKSRSLSDFHIIRKFIGQNKPIKNQAPRVSPYPLIEQTRSRERRRVDLFERDAHAKRIDWLKKEQRKYSSFDQNVVLKHIPYMRPDARQSKQPDASQQHTKWNFNVLNGGRLLTVRKNRSMTDFRAMKKLIVPNSFNQTQPHTRQLPMKMHSSQIYQTHSINSMNPSGSLNNKQTPTLQRTMNPNLVQMRRRFSVLGQPSRIQTSSIHSSPIQQTGSSGAVLLRHDQHSRSFPGDILDRGRYTKITDELNEQQPKYSSIYRNFIPDNQPAKQSKQQKERGRSGPRKNQPHNQSTFIVERVIRPVTFSSAGRALNQTDNIASALSDIAVTQKMKSQLGINQRQINGTSSKPDPFHLREVIARKKFPVGRATAPRTLIFKNRSALNGVRPEDNVSGSVSRVGFMSPGAGPMGNAGQANVLSKSRFQPFSIPPKQWSTTESISHGNAMRMVNGKQFSIQRHPQMMVSKKLSEIQPFFHQNHSIKNFQPPTIYYKQKSNTQLYLRRLVQMRGNQMNNFGQMKQPPKFLLKKRGMPVMNLRRQKLRQPHAKRRRSLIPIPQKRNPQMNIQKSVSEFRNTRPSSVSMIPVRTRAAQQNSGSLRRIPKQPFNRYVGLNQTKNIQRLNTEQIQSPLPVNVLNPRGKNPLRLPQMSPLRQRALPMPHKRAIQAHRSYKESKESTRWPYSRRATNPLRQMPPLPPFSSAQEQLILPDSLQSPRMGPVAKVDTSNLKINNPAVLFYAPGKLKLVDFPMPRITDEKEVIVKMLYVHLTDADAQILSAVQDGPYRLTQPTIAGKSGSGVIVEAGKKVEDVKVGDKVLVKGRSCGKCAACENDNEMMCERISTTEKLGTLKRFHAVRAQFVTKLPDSVHPIDGAMIDELSSAIRACKKSAVTAGDNVLVLGGKSLGLLTTLTAKSMGATNVCLADSRPFVLEQGKKLGIEQLFLIDPTSPTANTAQRIAEYMKGENPRIVFDCNGSPVTNEIAINTSMIGGKVVLMKNAVSNQPPSLASAVDRGIDILSSQHGNDDSERAALQFLSSGKVQLKGIDSSFFNITNVHEAFGLLTSGTTANVFIQPSRTDDERDGTNNG